MMRPDSKVEKVYLYLKPVDFRKSIDGLTALVELDIKVAVFDPVLFVFLNKARNRIKVLYWGAQRLLSLAQTPRSRTFQNLPRRQRRSDCPDRPRTELATRRFRPLAQPSASGSDAPFRRLTR
ncbi:IS66 family insertion sequence element accessory protein TnpB [Pseudomonas sp. P1B16]|uniref:IS66 family insertion sequence element accessory protein TnpB n=1 Tax=Pseudomonas sp. P1B16 TaxID=2986074 RepID=UPI002A23CD19|nr:IS66 family insertion sequence element accessory protein TnpB [Pseudomonas sp. P1B16]WPM28511.1 IS66 family insertion sequence element accessory protein TnpB [Pseudomonas sp. P1B16]